MIIAVTVLALFIIGSIIIAAFDKRGYVWDDWSMYDTFDENEW